MISYLGKTPGARGFRKLGLGLDEGEVIWIRIGIVRVDGIWICGQGTEG